MAQNTSNFTARQRCLRLGSSLGILIFGRILIPIAPLVSEWKWAYDTPTSTDINITSYTNGLINYMYDETKNSSEPLGLPQMSFKLMAISIAYPIGEFSISPFAGNIGDKFGYDAAALIGLTVALVLNALLTCTNTFWAVFSARFIQGISTAFLLPVGMARIMQVYPTEHKYHKMVMALALATKVFSILESTFAGFVIKYYGAYAWFIAMIPVNVFLIISVVLLYHFLSKDDDSEQLCETEVTSEKMVSLRDIVSDYQVIIASGSLTIAFMARIVLEPAIGLWIASKFNAGPEVTGLIWGTGGLVLIPAYTISWRFAQWKLKWMWLYGALHLTLCIVPIMFLPYASSPFLAGISVTIYLYCASCARYAMTIIFPVIAERKYHNSYGRVMAVGNFGSTLPYVIGPLCTVPLINLIGFKYTCLCIGSCYGLYPPLLYFLRNIELQNSKHFGPISQTTTRSHRAFVKISHISGNLV